MRSSTRDLELMLRDGKIHSVKVMHAELITPAEFRYFQHSLRLH
jgi:uncharacterized protein Usg